MTREPAKKELARRGALLGSARAFFEANGYLEVETPALVPSPGLDVHLDAFEVDAPTPVRYLTTSPEYQMKRLLQEGHRRIFQICRAYRRGEIGGRHNPEFTILEYYRSHAGIEDILRDTERLVARVLGGRVTLRNGRVLDAVPPFRRMTVQEAFATWAGVSTKDELVALAEGDEDRFYKLLVDEVEPGLAELDRLVFLTDYPSCQASLARKSPRDPRFAERFELYGAGVELCNGFGELTCAVEQRARFESDRREREKRGLPKYPIDEKFLDALAKGLPPCAGNAIGFDRLVALACGDTEIGRVLSFSHDEL